MKKLFTVLFVMMFTISAFAQAGKTTITGTMKNGDGKPLEAATVTLQHMPDKKLVKVNVTNTKGEFEFINIAEGTYQLLLTAVGYAPVAPVAVTVAAGQDEVKPVIAPLTRTVRALASL